MTNTAEASNANARETERARLLKAGYSEAEATQIVSARHGGEPILGSGAPAGVLNSFGAVSGAARNLLPGLKADLARLLDGGSSPAERIGAAIALAIKATVIAVIAYVASLEFTQLKAGAERAKAEACSARMKGIIDSVPMNKWAEANAALFRDCGPQ